MFFFIVTLTVVAWGVFWHVTYFRSQWLVEQVSWSTLPCSQKTCNDHFHKTDKDDWRRWQHVLLDLLLRFTVLKPFWCRRKCELSQTQWNVYCTTCCVAAALTQFHIIITVLHTWLADLLHAHSPLLEPFWNIVVHYLSMYHHLGLHSFFFWPHLCFLPSIFVTCFLCWLHRFSPLSQDNKLPD